MKRETTNAIKPHVHFFRYPHSFLRCMAPIPDRYRYESVGRDIYYVQVSPAAQEATAPKRKAA